MPEAKETKRRISKPRPPKDPAIDMEKKCWYEIRGNQELGGVKKTVCIYLFGRYQKAMETATKTMVAGSTLIVEVKQFSRTMGMIQWFTIGVEDMEEISIVISRRNK